MEHIRNKLPGVFMRPHHIVALSALLIVAISLPSTAKEIWRRGVPPDLINRYVSERQGCRSFGRRSHTEFISISKTSVTVCPNFRCDISIRGYRRIANGYLLRTIGERSWELAQEQETWKIEKLPGGSLEIETVSPRGRTGDKKHWLVCTMQDNIDGIGKPDEEYGGLTSRLFPLYYAQAVLKTCPSLLPTKDLTSAIRASDALLDAYYEPPNSASSLATRPGTIKELIRDEVESAILADERMINPFCDKVLEAFGEYGRAMTNLLKAKD